MVRRSVFCCCLALLVAGSGCASTRLWEPTRETVIARIVPSSVQIVLERDGKRFRTGSGVAIAARKSKQGIDCFVLTSGHTLADISSRDQVVVLFGRDHGAGMRVSAAVVGVREADDLDLALLQTRTGECVPAVFGHPPGLGDPIWVVAYPWGRNMTLVGGIVSQIPLDQPDDPDTAPRLIVDAPVSYGASGGGVYESRTGRLVGLVEGYRTARVSFNEEASARSIDVPVPGETYVVPLSAVQRFLLEIERRDLLGSLHALPTAQP